MWPRFVPRVGCGGRYPSSRYSRGPKFAIAAVTYVPGQRDATQFSFSDPKNDHSIWSLVWQFQFQKRGIPLQGSRMQIYRLRVNLPTAQSGLPTAARGKQGRGARRPASSCVRARVCAARARGARGRASPRLATACMNNKSTRPPLNSAAVPSRSTLTCCLPDQLARCAPAASR